MNLKGLETALRKIFEEVHGCRFLVLIDAHEKSIVMDMWRKEIHERDKIRESLLHILDYTVLERQKSARNPFIRKALQDFVSLTFEMERGYAVFTAIPSTRYVVASGISRETGLGLWRATLKKSLEEMKDAGN